MLIFLDFSFSVTIFQFYPVEKCPEREPMYPERKKDYIVMRQNPEKWRKTIFSNFELSDNSNFDLSARCEKINSKKKEQKQQNREQIGVEIEKK